MQKREIFHEIIVGGKWGLGKIAGLISVKFWNQQFKWGRESVHDDPKCGRSPKV